MSMEMDVNPTLDGAEAEVETETNCVSPFEGLDDQSAVAPEGSKLKRKPYRARSEVWEHFTKFTNAKGEQKARCNYCDRDFYADPKKNGTTSLKSHMGVCKKKSSGVEDPTQPALAFDPLGEGSLGTWKFNQDAIRRVLVEMIILDELPFKFVKGRGFKKFLAFACPRFHCPSRWTVARDCYQYYADEKIKLKQFLKESSVRLSLTTDTWTSLQRINYLCLTAHFIDKEWKLHKLILNFCPISSHKGEAIGRLIEKCLRDWGIDRVFTITVDNASSNDVAISYLRKKMISSGTCIKEGKFLHLRCIAHILNLIVTDGLKEMHDSVSRVRGVVRYVRQSPARLAKFRECRN